jgi:Tfp pilus assembly protein PilV
MTTGVAPTAADGTPSRAGEGGWALVETIASAVMLIVISLAVLSSLSTASRGTGENKGRSVAATLAEQDQERMRAMSVVQLSNYHPAAQTVTTSDGAKYTVTSRADWIRDSTDTTASCNDDSPPDYLRISSTVTSNVVGTDIKPVVSRTVVAPPVGSLGPGQGTLAVKVVNGAGNPLQNFPVSVSGPSSAPKSYSDVTNELGCAVFGYIPIGAYSASVTKSGYIDVNGNPTATTTGNVSEGKLTLLQLDYDIPGTITVSLNPAPSMATAATLSQTKSTPSTKRIAVAAGATTATFTNLFPFASSPYTAYAGACDAENPNSNGGTAPTLTLTSGGTGSMTGKLPLLSVKVVKGATTVAPAYIRINSLGSGCTYSLAATNFPSGTFAINVPYGTYTICGDDGNATLAQRKKKTVSFIHNDTTSASGGLSIDLNSTTGVITGSAC